MSYEKSAIAETTAAIPVQSPLQMREAREIDPYKVNVKPAPQAAPTGQPNISSEKVTPSLEETKGLPEETVTLSPQMAALARKEQKNRQRELDLKREREEIVKERAEIAEFKAMKAKLEAKDYSGIEGLVKYDDYTNYLIEKEQKSDPKEEKVNLLAKEIADLKNSQKEDIQKRFDAAVNERRKAVQQLVLEKPEFSRIKKAKAEEAVVKHILDTWEHESIDLSPEQAAKEVEELLLERATKWKELLDEEAKTDAVVEEDQKKQLPPLKPGIKTLTNNMAATGEVKRPVKSFQHMTDAERWAEARRRAEEKLRQGTRQ